MKEMRGIHKFTWLVPSAARCAALAVAFGLRTLAMAAACCLVAGGAWATDYYRWSAKNDTGNWNDYSNWEHSTDGESWAAATTGQYPQSKDAVVSIPADAGGETLTITGDKSYVGTLTISRAITLTGTFIPQSKSITTNNSSVLTLSGVTLSRKDKSTNGGLTVDCDVVVKETLKNATGSGINLNGKVSGDSSAVLSNNGTNSDEGFKLADMSGFYGTYTGSPAASGARDNTVLTSESASSENVVWTLGYRRISGADGFNPLLTGSSASVSDKTYYFGALNSFDNGLSLKSCTRVTLEIGKRDDVESTAKFNSSYLGTDNEIVKVGSNLLNMSGGLKSVRVKNGALRMVDTYMPGSITVEEPGAIYFNEYLTDEFYSSVTFEGVTRNVGVYKGESAVLAQTFAGVTDFTKIGGGSLELTAVPQWTGNVKVEDGLLIVPEGSSLTIAEDDTTTERVELADGRIMYYNPTATSVWKGTTGSNWAEAANWTNGKYPQSATDAAVIPPSSGGLTINFGTGNSYPNTGILTLARDVVFTGNMTVGDVHGPGILTLDSANLKRSGGAFYCDTCITNTVVNNDTTWTIIYFRGALLGDTNAVLHCNSTQGAGFQFYGDTSRFAGTCKFTGYSNRDRDGGKFHELAKGSALAAWENFGRTKDGDGVFQDSGSYEFGQLTATKNFKASPAKNLDIEVGALTEKNSEIGGTLADNSNVLRKVGSGNSLILSLDDNYGTVEVAEGTLYLKGSKLPAALKLTGKDAVVYVISTLDASSLVASSLAAYTVTKSDETETISNVEYYKYTLTKSATSVATDDSGTVYATIGDAVTNAVSGATITITGTATDNAVIPDGKTFTFVFDGGSYSGTLTADDGGTVLDGSSETISSGTTTYACKKLYTHVDDLVGSNTLDDGAYYTSADSNFNLPGKAAGAVGTLTITGVGNSLDVRRNIFIGPRDNTTGRINVVNDGVLVHTEDTDNSSVVLGNKAGAEGTLNVDGGAFTNKTGEIRIGGVAGSTGRLIVSAGEFYDAVGKVRVGMAQESTGLVEFTGGTFEIPETANSSNPYIDIAEGQSSHGEVLVGGTASLTIKNLPVGRGASSQGWLTVADNASVSISTSLNAGYSANSYGKVLIEDSASLIVTGSNGVTLGNANSATGIVEVAGGSVSIPDNDSSYYDIGNYSGARGELIVSGGTVSAQYYNVGNKAGAEAAMTVSSGTVTANSHIAVGGNYNGSGTLTGTTATYEQTGGAVTTKDFHVGYCAASTGTATISGGTLTMSGGDLALAKSGSGATATLVINGGTVTSTKSLLMGGAGTATIDVTIGGGESAAVADFATGILFARNGSTANTKEAITLLPNGTLRVDTIKAPNDTVSDEAYVLFNGGVLAPHSNKDISSASMLQQDESQKLSFIIGEGGMIVSNDYAAAIDMTGVVAADGVSTPRLVKKGSGVLRLTTAPTFSGTITVVEDGGSVIVPNTSTVTAGTDTVRNSGEGDTYVFTYSASSSALEPGETDGNEYDTLEAAQTAAEAITDIAIPSAVSSVVTTSAQIEAYKALFSAQAVASTTTEGKYEVVVDFKSATKTELESTLTQEFADVDFTSIATTGASVTIDSPIAGLYYGVLKGDLPTGLTLSGSRALSNGSTLNLTLPSGEGNVQFYKLEISTSAE